ncbi:hypothetical protein GOBAR_AA04772 [Gossypium barbadense]|uniref:Exocyst subunit Exo70 family protein n=1 Tax=Gossypium barbadense TaxID=3634 RepID=A0A2P5YJN1_GOSBA|nr:hypothetical protein GOBAR_AA04772 [Gossypium barbadense]
MELPENLNKDSNGYESAEKIILRWDSTASEDARERMIFETDRQEADLYLQAVDEIQRSLSNVSISTSSNAGKNANAVDDQSKVNTTIQIAMARLEDEFRNILITHSSALETDSLLDPSSSSISTPSHHELEEDDTLSNDDSSHHDLLQLQLQHCESSDSSTYRSTSSIREVDLMPSEAICDLQAIAMRMISSGYLRECIQVYGSVRKSAIDSSFRKLGIEKLSIGDVQRLEWEALESKIRRWIRAAKVCVRILFASEKKLCEQIFECVGTDIDDACFMETVKGPAIQLFNFAEAISISRRSPEKLFKILDLHDALAEAARGILSEFESAVLREPSRVPVPGGTIHPLTRYSGDQTTPDMEFAELEGKTPLALHLIWIIVVLQFNLDGKSKHYRDASLAHLFIMNNVHYIVQKVKGSPELREMIGDDYLRKLTGKFRQAATSYQRATWVSVLYCLRDEGLHVSGSFSSGVSKSALRERFKTFNAMFEEVHRTQATWLIPDTQLREELRISISEKLIPAYRSFLGRFRSHIESGRHPENYIKYSVEDLETAVLDFFEGYPVSQHLRKRSQVFGQNGALPDMGLPSALQFD